ncbi:hypothetical protein IJ118_00600 [Candidatus Saccharibacteria bacterium]|nr:hypothetical protein [Candidatus Saccharibacteria bacterium]
MGVWGDKQVIIRADRLTSCLSWTSGSSPYQYHARDRQTGSYTRELGKPTVVECMTLRSVHTKPLWLMGDNGY